MSRISKWISGPVPACVGVGALCAGVLAVPVGVPVTAVAAEGASTGFAGIVLAATESITLDLVRHGQSVDNVEGILGTVPPGAPLTDVGEQQAQEVATQIDQEFGGEIAGLYASQLIRTQETAAPLADLLHMTPQILSGLNEVNAGLLEGDDLTTFTEIAYVLPTVMWILGNYTFPILGSDIDPNGMAFQDRVTDAIQTIYDNTVNDADDGKLTDIVFSHAGTITAWTLMNVKNPDFGIVLDELVNTLNPLRNTGQVVLEGNPTDGWTLVSWDGHEVAAQPDLFTGLFVDWRDLITVPQMAAWHIWEAIQGGDADAIGAAFETGFNDVIDALLHFPQAVIDTITAAFDSDAAGAAESTDGAETATSALDTVLAS